jgi:energy-coupling factor transporter ATP-binding protein EcfA2
VLIITHDRYFLDNVTGWILELDRGRGIPYEGNYSAYLGAKAKRMAQEGREEATRQKALEREREWIAASPKARQAKSKARIRAYDELVNAASDRRPGDAQIIIPAGERLGNVVIEAEGLTKGFSDRLLIADISFTLPPVVIVGVIGPNGAGKTTLFRMITGQDEPGSGAIRIGETVKLGYVDQSRDHLDPHKGLFLPYGVGAVLVRDDTALLAAHVRRAAYLQDAHDAHAASDDSPTDRSPELTKHWRGPRMWLPLMLFGIRPFRACLEEKRLLARDESARAHVYRPSVAREEVQTQVAKHLLDRLFGGSPRSRLAGVGDLLCFAGTDIHRVVGAGDGPDGRSL